MNNSTALRLALQAERHQEKAREALRRIEEEHPLGSAMRDAFSDEQSPVTTDWRAVVRHVIEEA